MEPVSWVVKASAMMPLAENYFLTLGTRVILHISHKFAFVIVLEMLMYPICDCQQHESYCILPESRCLNGDSNGAIIA
jgi:hypothetical protein